MPFVFINTTSSHKSPLEPIDEETSEQLECCSKCGSVRSAGVPTLLEKMGGLFTSSDLPSPSEVPSLFANLDELFNEEVVVPPNSAASSSTSSYVLTPSDRPAAPLGTPVDVSTHSSLQCVCFNCWKMAGSLKTWKSPDEPVVPQLAKSPVDSIKMLTNATKTDEMVMTSSADPTIPLSSSWSVSSTTSSSSSSSSASSSCTCTITTNTTPISSIRPSTNTTSGIVPDTPTEWTETTETETLAMENAMLREKIDLQADIIAKMLRLGALSDRLAALRSRASKGQEEA